MLQQLKLKVEMLQQSKAWSWEREGERAGEHFPLPFPGRKPVSLSVCIWVQVPVPVLVGREYQCQREKVKEQESTSFSPSCSRSAKLSSLVPWKYIFHTFMFIYIFIYLNLFEFSQPCVFEWMSWDENQPHTYSWQLLHFLFSKIWSHFLDQISHISCEFDICKTIFVTLVQFHHEGGLRRYFELFFLSWSILIPRLGPRSHFSDCF